MHHTQGYSVQYAEISCVRVRILNSCSARTSGAEVHDNEGQYQGESIRGYPSERSDSLGARRYVDEGVQKCRKYACRSKNQKSSHVPPLVDNLQDRV